MAFELYLNKGVTSRKKIKEPTSNALKAGDIDTYLTIPVLGNHNSYTKNSHLLIKRQTGIRTIHTVAQHCDRAVNWVPAAQQVTANECDRDRFTEEKVCGLSLEG